MCVDCEISTTWNRIRSGVEAGVVWFIMALVLVPESE
jgi:hypothetical protein